ncbi:MAG: hypothetical protein ACHQDB_01120 [Steroidobacterales bacterium]
MAYNSLQVDRTHGRRGDNFDRSGFQWHRCFDGAKGNLRIFYAGCPHIGVVLGMRRAQALMAQMECLPLKQSIDAEVETDVDVAAALDPRPLQHPPRAHGQPFSWLITWT